MKFYSKNIFVLAFLLVSNLLPLKAIAADAMFEEYQVKAALLFKLVSFVTWPVEDQQQSKGSDNFTICTLGGNDFNDILNTLSGLSSNSKFINIKYFEQSKSLEGRCQIVFISDSKRASLKSILRNIQDLPILTVSDTESFAESGGMVQFKDNNGRLGIDINLDAATSANLKISAPLLQLANIVETVGNRLP